MLGIDVNSSRELQALILSVRRANREIQGEIRKHTKTMITPEWRKALAEQSLTKVEQIVLVDTARVTVSNQNVTLRAGGLAKKLSGGAKAFEIAPQVEFGTPMKVIKYSGRRGTKRFPVTRRGNMQFRQVNKRGWVVYPAVAQILPRLAALWVQTAVRTFAEAIEKK
ncbi:MAG: hypothetical protein LCH36_00335 [Actinobacteria bacterium]|nr:hypothetical protein [Actinomycetota bacterium]